MRAYLQEAMEFLQASLFILWMYLVVSMRFLRWRMQLWWQPYRLVESIPTAMKQTLLLIRHGQTTWNVEHRLPGQLAGVALNDTGREQARHLAEALKDIPISALISSPLERARDTATAIAEGRNLTIQFEPDLMDTNIGHWAGQVIQELSKNDPQWNAYVKDPTSAPEGVETFPQVQQRVVAAIERWRKQDVGAYPAFVGHADVVKLILAYYMGLDAKHAGSLLIENASVSLVSFEDEQHPRITALGWSPRPGWLKPPIAETPPETPQTQEVGEQKT